MVFAKLIQRNQYHKNGTQWVGKLVVQVIGEKKYDYFRLLRRINYAKFWYRKQYILTRFQMQYPHIAQWFSLLNKTDTSAGYPARRQYERYQDFAVYNINNEGWFQCYFAIAGAILLAWNYWVIAGHWSIRGENVSDQDLYRWRDARITTNYDRTKYKFNYYFMGTHFNAVTRRAGDDKDHPDNPRVSY
jgi:hypothetical protein